MSEIFNQARTEQLQFIDGDEKSAHTRLMCFIVEDKHC